jgi:lysyl-tRNA synthetase class 2
MEPYMAENTLDRIRQERIEKASSMRETGQNPFANDFRVSDQIAPLRASHEHLTNEDPQPTEETPRHQVSGRVIAKRVMGKLSFLKIRDASGELQLMVRKDLLGDEEYTFLKRHCDVGDHVGTSGPMIRTRTQELSILADSVRVLTKSLRPLPDKWHGLTDVETRIRQRYVDLIMNPEVRDVFKVRADVVKHMRRFLDERDFLEVETPMLHTIAGGAAAKPFKTHHNALDIPMYLRIAPELFLKRLVVGGLERVYEINRNFRNEGLSHWHNPEFTMLEFYMAHATYEDMIELTEEMLNEIAKAVRGSEEIDWLGHQISFARPFARMTIREAIAHFLERPDLELETADQVQALMEELEIEPPKPADYGRMLMEIYETVAEPKLVQPTFITQFPVEVSPLARKNEEDPRFVDRYELIIGGKEVSNAFSELNDPVDQKQRFEGQMDAKAKGDDEAHDMDEDYVRALEYGMPPTAGQGIGVDRIVMLMAGKENIREVILFPHMRPENMPLSGAQAEEE